MAERASIFEVAQLGVETTPGTSVAANRKLGATSIEPSINVGTTPLVVRGAKLPFGVVLGKEWATASVRGQASYTDIVYLLSSALSKATPVQQGTSAAYKWVFGINQSGADTVATYTVETGSDVRAGKFAYGIIPEIGISFTRDTVEVSGTMVGREYQDGITLTASPTQVEVVPVLPAHVSVYMDTTSGAIGTTKLARVLRAEFRIADRFSQLWTLDASQDSWTTHIETQPAVTLNMLVEADSAGMELLTALRNGEKRFVRLAAVGPVADGAYNYTLQIDLAGMVSDVGQFSDEDGLFAVEWTLQAVYDSVWGKAIEVAVINTLSAL